MRVATPREKRKAMSVMLKGSALSLFTRKGQGCEPFKDGITLLGSRYNSKDKQRRLLPEWQSMSLSSAMEKKPEESEVSLFRTFVSNLMSLHNQLYLEYHSDLHLRDRLFNAVNPPSIKDSIKYRTPRTAHQPINRVSNRLSINPRTARSVSALVVSPYRAM